MLTLIDTKDGDVLSKILSDKQLFKLTNGRDKGSDESLIEDNFNYKIIKSDDDVVGCFRYRSISNTTLEGHISILPKYWNTGVPQESVKQGMLWAKENKYLKLFAPVPSSCIHMLQFLQNLGFTCCGMIKDGVIYNNQLATLFFYEIEV